MRRWILATASTSLAALLLAPMAGADTNISDRTYVRHDGGSDVTIASCNDDSPGTTAAGERQQNEPTAAVNPLNTLKLTSGANDYCPVPTTTDAWAGFYYSGDGGGTWTNSLLPGYPTDTSAEGRASPLFGLVTSAGDPVQDWDRSNHLYYGGIAFNRARPANGSIWVARYNWGPPFAAPDHEFTTLVSRGTPSPIFLGHFEDKIELEADDGAASPFAGNVYVCWARFTGSGTNNFIEFARSTDGGRTWTTQKVSESIHGVQGCDIAVTRTGLVFVHWRQYGFKPDQGQRQADAIAWARSSDGGATFTKPAVSHEFLHWDMNDDTLDPVANGIARYQACLAADGTLGGCSGPEPRADARDCGDGPLACDSGYVFGRVDSSPRNAADPVAGQGDEAYVVIEATVPGTQRPSGTSYNTLEDGVASQGSIYFTKTENAGATWTPLVRIDPQARGNQFYPDIDANAGRLHALWQDTRASTRRGRTARGSPCRSRTSGCPRTRRVRSRVARRPDVLRHCSRDRRRLDDVTGLVRHVQAELGAVRQPRRPVLRGLQLRLSRRLEGPADVDRRPEHGLRNGSAVHERGRHRRLRRAPVPHAEPGRHLERRHLCERGRPRPEHLGARPRLAVNDEGPARAGPSSRA